MSQPQPSTTSDSSNARRRSQRVLACVLCQQRKVKCDRRFPCANCSKYQKECIPATVTPRRPKRRFPERDLLERVREYEALLRENNIEFRAFQSEVETNPSSTASPNAERDDVSYNQQERSQGTATTPKESTEAKSLWRILRKQWPQRPNRDEEAPQDGVSHARIQRAMDQIYGKNDHFLFGVRHTPTILSTLHPEPVQIFRLWQIYLDNIDPLLKVTHTPTLQGRIIEAASNVSNVNSTLEALMFSIYAIAVMSLTVDECQNIFNSPRDELLGIYQYACQQALLNCGYLRTSDRECLTAFYLFLLSIGPNTDPRSLSPMLGVAMRIAIRMGIHRESDTEKSSPFEIEMRRRLWWALKLIDSRIGELADSKSVALDPIWDCKIPLNVNDAELRPEMKSLPFVQGSTSDALFVVVRSVLGDFIRFAEFHLDFTNPQLKSVAKAAQHDLVPESRNLVAFEKLIEDLYLRFCSTDNPLHLMTLCMARSQLAKYRLLEHYWRYSDSPESQTDAKRDIMIRNALIILENDSKIMSSPSTKGYRWLLQFYFPFPAYVHALQDLQRRPFCSQAMEAWNVLSNHFEIRVNVPEGRNTPFFDLFTNLVLSAWKEREDALARQGEEVVPPSIVSIIREKTTEENTGTQCTDQETGDLISSVNSGGMPATGLCHMPYEPGSQYIQPNSTFLMHSQFQLQPETNSLPLQALDWTFGASAF